MSRVASTSVTARWCAGTTADDSTACGGGRSATPRPAAISARSVSTFFALERDPRREPGLLAQLLGERAEPVALAQQDERLVRDFRQPDPLAMGEAMGRGHGKAQRFDEQPTPTHPGMPGIPAGQHEVDDAVEQVLQDRFLAVLTQLEAHHRVRLAEAADQRRDQPGAQRVQERDWHDAAVGVDQLGDRTQAEVVVVERLVEVAFEDAARRGQSQCATHPGEQRRTDLTLQPGQRPGQRRLRDVRVLRGLGHRGTLGHGLEPAQHLKLHASMLARNGNRDEQELDACQCAGSWWMVTTVEGA